MTEKRFMYFEHKGADYILDNPNTELDFIEMLGDALSSEEIVDLLNEQDKRIKELEEENKQLKEELGSFEQVSFTDLCDKSRTILYMKKENVGDLE